jgi:recombination associated protein RdgC
VALTPDSAPLLSGAGNPRDWSPTSFSPEVEDSDASVSPGEDFLTWLWFLSEARGGTVALDSIGTTAILIDGPLTFFSETGGAQEAVVRKGEPRLSAEAKTALLGGKKLRRAKLTLALDDERTWSTTLDASFAFRGLKLPEGEKLDAVSKFQERQIYLDQFRSGFFELYDRFCRDRVDSSAWSSTLAEMQTWIRDRKTRP